MIKPEQNSATCYDDLLDLQQQQGPRESPPLLPLSDYNEEGDELRFEESDSSPVADSPTCHVSCHASQVVIKLTGDLRQANDVTSLCNQHEDDRDNLLPTRKSTSVSLVPRLPSSKRICKSSRPSCTASPVKAALRKSDPLVPPSSCEETTMELLMEDFSTGETTPSCANITTGQAQLDMVWQNSAPLESADPMLNLVPTTVDMSQQQVGDEPSSGADAQSEAAGAFKCTFPGCGRVFSKSQALGGHYSKAHSGLSENYKRKLEARDQNAKVRRTRVVAEFMVSTFTCVPASKRPRVVKAVKKLLQERTENILDIICANEDCTLNVPMVRDLFLMVIGLSSCKSGLEDIRKYLVNFD